MEKLVVPRLERLALEKSYKEILSNLFLCREHRPENTLLDCVSDSSIIAMILPFLTSQNVISFVRNRLSQNLVGVMSDKIRKELVKKFYETFNKSNNKIAVDIHVLLECLLDKSFEELETHISYHDGEPNAEVIPTIAKHSSQLKELKIDFSLMKREALTEKVNLVISSLISLEQLSTLHLSQINESLKAVLKFVGNACPLLTHFIISGFRTSPTDFLAIILGEYADKLFAKTDYFDLFWKERGGLSRMRAPPEILTAFCFTLRRLQLGNTDDWNKQSGDCRRVMAFALRHLPLLEKLDGFSTFIGVEHLNCSLETDEDKPVTAMGVTNEFGAVRSSEKNKRTGMGKAAKFEKICHQIIANLPNSDSSPLSIEQDPLLRPTFSGTLLLTRLDCVSLGHGYRLPIIKKMCPNLKDVVFYQSLPGSRDVGDGRSADKLIDDFNGWPKLETITLAEMFCNEYTRAMLKIFGPHLKHLIFKQCHEVDVSDLVVCTQLESLQFIAPEGRYGKNNLSPMMRGDQQPLNPHSFLPQLKSIQSDTCLGQWASLFENKYTLTRIVLNCCHFRVPGSSLDWNSVPKMWPSLEIFRVHRCEGMTISTMFDIVPQLGKMKELSFPEEIIEEEEKLTVAILIEDLKHRTPPIDLHFQVFGKGCCCSFMEGLRRVPTELNH